MKEVGKTMGLLMGVSLSFLLSLIGTLSSGTFSFPSFLTSFLISLVISSIITRIIPLNQITTGFSQKLKLQRGSVKCRLFETLISDLLMSPLMTFIMVFIAYKQATSHGARIPFVPMLLRSEIISFIAAYVFLFFLTPLFLKYALKKAGIDPHEMHQ